MVRTRIRAWNLSLAVVIIAATASGCAPAPPPAPASPPAPLPEASPQPAPIVRSTTVWGTPSCQVGLIGDSLSVGARDFGDVVGRFAEQGCTSSGIDAVVGRSTTAGAVVAEQWAAAGVMPRILVVALGTNDCNEMVFEAAMQRILGAAGPDRPVVWVNTWREGCDTGINQIIKATQDALNLIPGREHQLSVIDHNAWVASNPGVLARDGIHLNKTGYEQHAMRIATHITTGSR